MNDITKALRRILPVALAAVISLGIADYISFQAQASEYSAPAAKSKKKKKRRSRKKRLTKRKSSRTRKKTTGKAAPAPVPETPQFDSLTLRINEAVLASIPQKMNPGGLRVNSVKPDSLGRIARISLNENFTYLPVTQEFISDLNATASKALPDSLANYSVTLSVNGRSLAYYINKIDKLPPQRRVNPAFVKAKEPYIKITEGMDGDIVAMWHSHGRYFKPGSGAWMWQRPLLFETVEDTFTMGFVLPYIVPMLENAGAYVMLPRERDTNRYEVIVDNDANEGGELYSQPYYREQSGEHKWTTGDGEGFIYDLKEFRDTENPFEVGTYRQVVTTSKGKPSVAAWYADIPEDGNYAIYISYKSLPNSTKDAHYAVNYSGGTREFIVNQQMGGGTWIYLGTFPLQKGYSDSHPIVTLTNLTDGEQGCILTADALKIGGGMGNIARSNYRSDIYYDPSTPEKDLKVAQEEEEGEEEEIEEVEEEETTEEDESPDEETTSTKAEKPEEKKGSAPIFRTSGFPRFLEGARYWLQWAGMPEGVYSPYHGTDDYKDDYTSRGHWVNYLAGGSSVLPNREGLKIPVDVAMALHSDAGRRSDDSFVGTLGIYFSQNGDIYRDGTPRINSRMLTDLLQRQICGDIRQTLEPAWTRRSMWDKSYVEARVPEVPTALIELLSHQNFADMRYGLDPTFRFTVGRAVYKALARFMSERKDRKLVIQPLPVKDFMIQRTGKNTYRLSWQPTPDPLEPTAMPKTYIIMERRGDDLGFHKVGETSKEHFDVKVKDHDIHSFRIIAANEGGVSFPGETLALRESPKGEKPVLILNGFERIAAPASFNDGTEAGFRSEEDFGVPYIKDISFTGHQAEFRRSAGSFGNSGSVYAAQVIAGNTFDYPAEHGRSIAAAGKGFISASTGAVERGALKLGDYSTIDMILGKQKATVIGNGSSGVKFRAFGPGVRHELEKFLKAGGKLFVSGQYVASDPLGMRASAEEREFAHDVLGLAEPSGEYTRSGRFAISGESTQIPYSCTLNADKYIVERPDNLHAAEGIASSIIAEFPDTGEAAALLMKDGKSRRIIMSVPFESITDRNRRDFLMARVLSILEN